MSLIRYSLQDIQDIKHNGFTYELPEYSLMLINKISKQVGAPSYIKTPIFKKNRMNQDNNSLTLQQSMEKPNINNNKNDKKKINKRNKKHGGGRELTDEEWNSIRKFETTKMEQAKDECEKALNNIRSLLNKLSDSNYDTIRDEIMFAFYELEEKNLIDVNDTNKLWRDICNLIIDTSCMNAFYSKQYVQLLTEIYKKYNSIEKEFMVVLKNSVNSLYDIKYIDPEKDYDGFCNNNIVSQRRKSFATFISNLYAFNLIEELEYTEIIYNLLNSFNTNITIEDKGYICEELSEIINSIIGTNQEKLCNMNHFKECIEHIRGISQMKRKNYKSLSNKAIFKFCDIIESF